MFERFTRWLCSVGVHSWEYILCESGHEYPRCRRCGAWDFYGIEYPSKDWPPPYPGMELTWRSIHGFHGDDMRNRDTAEKAGSDGK